VSWASLLRITLSPRSDAASRAPRTASAAINPRYRPSPSINRHEARPASRSRLSWGQNLASTIVR